MHSFLTYLPISLALNTGHALDASLFRGLVSFVYVSLWAITSAATNDFFDRVEDLGFKDNPFDEYENNAKTGLACILTLQTLSLLFSFVAALALDTLIIFLSVFGSVVSWLYSDNTYAARMLGFRLKSHYPLEIFAIVFGYAMLFASTLAINRVLIVEAIPLLILVALAFCRETIRKDYAQTVKDSQAGNMTFPLFYGLGKADRIIIGLTYANLLSLGFFVALGLLPFLTILGSGWFLGEVFYRRQSYGSEHKLHLLLDLNPYFLLISVGLLLR